MVRRICFFSAGFAFNRLVRLRYYEKIFPKDVKIFLITTDKHKDSKKWDLQRTEIIVLRNSPLKNLFKIRKFCKKENIDTLSNLGHPFGTIPLIFSSIFSRRKTLLYFLGDVIDIHKTTNFSLKKAKLFTILIPYFILSLLSDKVAFVGHRSFEKAPIVFLLPRKKIHYLLAPTDTKLFKPINKRTSRKSLGLSQKKRIVLYVGRISYLKGGDMLSQLIRSNPDVEFIVIGKWLDEEIPKINDAKNLIHIEGVPNKKLPEYYSAADLVFAYNRQGDQPQIIGGEALSCGVPVFHTRRVYLPDRDFIIKIDDTFQDANKKLKSFFLDVKKDDLRKKAREYAVKYLSDEYWESKYLEFYLH